MFSDYFNALEDAQKGDRISLASVLENLAFDHNGLIPVITQHHLNREVLMMAWMNQTALEKTLTSGTMTYWSRSRSQLWLKGESSGNFQQLKSMRIDCDGDTLLCEVEPRGPACHTGRPSCFYLQVDGQDRDCACIVDSAPKQSATNR